MKSPIVWNPAMATGVRQIDLQHQELIDIINELGAARDAGSVAHAMDDVLPRLSAYVLFHFGTEEAMVAGLDGAAEHVKAHVDAHRAFAERIAALTGHAGTAAELSAFVDFLKAWLLDHIMRTDRELVRLIVNAKR